MSKTFGALIAKFAMTFLAATVAFRFIGDASWGTVSVLSLGATVANYLLGDLLILRIFGNLVASFSDGILGVGVAMLLGVISADFSPSVTSLVLFGAIVVIGEYLFHSYLLRTEEVAP